VYGVACGVCRDHGNAATLGSDFGACVTRACSADGFGRELVDVGNRRLLARHPARGGIVGDGTDVFDAGILSDGTSAQGVSCLSGVEPGRTSDRGRQSSSGRGNAARLVTICNRVCGVAGGGMRWIRGIFKGQARLRGRAVEFGCGAWLRTTMLGSE